MTHRQRLQARALRRRRARRTVAIVECWYLPPLGPVEYSVALAMLSEGVRRWTV